MKNRGRPRLEADDDSVTVSFRLPSKQFDATQKQADEARMSMPEWLRRIVTKACREPKGRSS